MKSRKPRLSAYEVAEIIWAKKITSHLHLMAFAAARNCKEQKTWLSLFAIGEGTLLTNAINWSKQQPKKRMQGLKNHISSSCRKWATNSAQKVVTASGYRPLRFGNEKMKYNCVFESCIALLEKGRGKYRNLFIHGAVILDYTTVLPNNEFIQNYCNCISSYI